MATYSSILFLFSVQWEHVNLSSNSKDQYDGLIFVKVDVPHFLSVPNLTICLSVFCNTFS